MALWNNLRNPLLWTAGVWLASLSFNAPDPPGLRPALPAETVEITDVTIVAAGDLISHQDVQAAALQAEKGWASLWEEITPLFKGADLAMLNLETPIAPRTGKPPIPYCFNAPAALAQALGESGIDLVFTANNHAFDQRAAGLAETHGHLESFGVRFVGSGLGREAAEAPALVELPGGIVAAVFARTDLFNDNLNRGGGRPWVAALDLEKDARLIREARAQADVVFVSVHWGNEYEKKPSPRQREAAKALVEAGADVVVGHHPHVLQPFEWVEAGGRRGAVAFSLGNFLSNQHRKYNPEKHPIEDGDNRDGALLLITLRRDSSGVHVRDARVEPVWTDNNWPAHVGRVEAKRVIRVLTTAPGERGPELEGLLAKRRARADETLGKNSPAHPAAPLNDRSPDH